MFDDSSFLREMKTFDYYVRYLWPFHRVFVKHLLSKRCKKCILSENYVSLNQEGICEECLQEKENESIACEKKEELDSFLKGYAKKGEKYDALVLLSGGKDSIFLIHELKRRFPALRILAVTVDNSFMSPLALENVEKTVSGLDVDHVFARPKPTTLEKMYSYAFRHLNEDGCSGTVDQFDGDMVHDVARNMASNMKIPLLISGVSRTQVRNIFGLEDFRSLFENEKRKRVAGIDLKEIFSEDEMRIWWDGFSTDFVPQVVFPFYVWHFEEDFLRKKASEITGIPVRNLDPRLTNNRLIPLMGLVDMAQLGYSSFSPEFAKRVRQKKSDREFWLHTFELLEYSAETGRFISDSVNNVLDRLNLSKKELGIGR